MICDFHSHTFLSDGELSPIEAIRRAAVQGYAAIALTDHAAFGGVKPILETVARDCEKAAQRWDILPIAGIELTHCPPALIDEAARQAREMGARIVLVHGETVVEPVEQGTNRAAIESEHVDVLAHPGLVTPEEARLAAERGIFFEITSRKGHCLTNGHVARVALEAGVPLLLSSDAHSPEDYLSESMAWDVLLGAGLGEGEAEKVLRMNPQRLLAKLCLCI